jgi:hypothetical protein
MSRSEKRNHVLSEKDPISQTQVTMALHEVDALLTALDRTPKQRLWEKYSRASSLYIIVENWDVDMSEFPLRHHNRDFRPGNWDTRSLATLAVLSEFTQGQGAQMGIFLCYAVELRVGTGRLPERSDGERHRYQEGCSGRSSAFARSGKYILDTVRWNRRSWWRFSWAKSLSLCTRGNQYTAISRSGRRRVE